MSDFGAHVTMRNCRIFGQPEIGVLVDRGASALIEDCEISSCKTTGVYAIEAQRCEIVRCTISDCKEAAVTKLDSRIGRSFILISDCVFKSNPPCTIWLETKEGRSCDIRTRIESEERERENMILFASLFSSIFAECRFEDTEIGISLFVKNPTEKLSSAFAECNHNDCFGNLDEYLDNVISNPKR